MASYQWTTDLLNLETGSEALEDYKQIVLSIRCGSLKKDLFLDDESHDFIINETGDGLLWDLGQLDTAQFKGGAMKMQLNIYYTDGSRRASDPFEYKYDKNMYEKYMDGDTPNG